MNRLELQASACRAATRVFCCAAADPPDYVVDVGRSTTTGGPTSLAGPSDGSKNNSSWMLSGSRSTRAAAPGLELAWPTNEWTSTGRYRCGGGGSGTERSRVLPCPPCRGERGGAVPHGLAQKTLGVGCCVMDHDVIDSRRAFHQRGDLGCSRGWNRARQCVRHEVPGEAVMITPTSCLTVADGPLQVPTPTTAPANWTAVGSAQQNQGSLSRGGAALCAGSGLPAPGQGSPASAAA
jgi:hypothetical protein